ncbi:MAG: hypothetical protein WBG71_15220 [Leeuwenhoekiella sp.]
MSLGTLIRLKKPKVRNRKILGLVTFAVLLILLSGGLYYFHIKANQEQFKQNKMHLLDDHFSQLRKKLSNDLLSELSKLKKPDSTRQQQDSVLRKVLVPQASTKASFIEKDSILLDYEPSQPVKDTSSHQQDSDTLTKAFLLETLNKQWKTSNMGEDFSEFLIVISKPKYKGDTVIGNVPARGTLFIENQKVFDTLFKKQAFNLPTIAQMDVLGENFQIFSRLYQFDEHDLKANIRIIGMVDQGTYAKATRKLDPWVIALLATFALLCIFGLPFFKMIFIAEDERLFSRDVLLAGFSVLVGFPIIISVFLSIANYFGMLHVVLPNRLEHMTDTLVSSFIDENHKTAVALRDVDLKPYQDSLAELAKDTLPIFLPQTNDTSLIDNFKFITQVNDMGKIAYHINFIKKPDPENTPTDISRREYFQDFVKIKKNIWQDTLGFRYLMRPVVSIEDGTEEAVYIINDSINGKAVFKVGSSQMASVHNSVLPFGYQFAIVDGDGEVWFHSTPGKSTLENLLKISRNTGSIQAALIGRVKANGQFYYHGKKQRYYLQPITGTNLTAITFYDVGLLRIRTSEVLTITGVAVLFAFLLTAFVAILTVAFRRTKWGLYKHNNFLFEFMTPKKNQKDHYILLSLIYIVFIVLSIVIMQFADFPPVSALTASLLYILWSYFLLYVTLNEKPTTKKNKKRNKSTDKKQDKVNTKSKKNTDRHDKKLVYDFAVMLLGIFIVCISPFIAGIIAPEPEDAALFIKARNMIILAATMLIVVPLIYIFLSYRKSVNFRRILIIVAILVLNTLLWVEGSKNAPAFSAALFLQWLCLIFLFRHKLKNLAALHDQAILEVQKLVVIPYRHWYATFLFTWVILASILPTIVFFTKARAIDDYLWVKSEERYMLNRYIDKSKILRTKNLQAIPGKEARFEALYKRHLSKGQYGGENFDQISPSNDSLDKITGPGPFRDLLWNARPIYDEQLREFQAMAYEQASDGSWFGTEDRTTINLLLKDATKDHNSLLARFKKPIKFNARVLPFENWSDRNAIYHSLVSLLSFFLILALLFALILYYVDRFFGFRFGDLKPSNFDSCGKDNYLGKFAGILKKSDANTGLMLIGPPVCGKEQFANRAVAKAGFKSGATLSFLRIDALDETADIQKIFEKLCISTFDKNGLTKAWDEMDVYIIKNMEHGLKSYEANHIKLRLLSHLIAKRHCMVLTSEVYPSQILGFYTHQTSAEGYLEPKFASDFYSWRDVLSAFPQVLLGLTTTKAKKTVAKELNVYSKSGTPLRKKDRKLLKSELGYSIFLPALTQVILARSLNHKNNRIDQQRMVLHTQNMAHGYYTDIWNSLPTRERYVLYDLAYDGFMNIKNSNSLFSLMKKGLIVWRDRPAIFNTSFKNFVVSSVSQDEALKLELKNSGKGAWGTIRIVFYLMIIAMIAFILLGEPGLIKDFEALIATLGGLGVVVPIMTSVLTQGQK